MSKEKFIMELKEQSKQIYIELDDNMIEQFYSYMNLLLEWNKNINLTAITEEQEIITKHFIDSITINKFIKEDDTIIDVGTGAGFPGIPIKITRPNCKIILLDSLNKRLNFLKTVIDKINLKNIETIHYRAEDAGINKQYRESFDIATSRAVAPLNVLVEYLLPFVKIGGKCICMKASNIEEEIENSKKAIDLLGGRIEKIEEFCLPNTNIVRTIIIIKKEIKTPEKYPRKAGTPSKQPLN